MTEDNQPLASEQMIALLRCPQTGESLRQDGDHLVTESGTIRYKLDDSGVPLFAADFLSEEALTQQQHYDRIAETYAENLTYPHTLEYMSYLDDALRDTVNTEELGCCAEICCGTGEAFALFDQSIAEGVGIDVSISMLRIARKSFKNSPLFFVQGDATRLPLKNESFDSVIVLGGIHHVPDRRALFAQIFRILKPGGVFIWREPVSDLWLWKLLRSVVYRVSPMLDHETEKPLTYDETVPLLTDTGFSVTQWQTYGFLGFCIFMNSDVLFFNRFFRFIPGIRAITRLFDRFAEWCPRRSLLRRAGLQVIGKATKPNTGTLK